jgi:hypothetical protein
VSENVEKRFKTGDDDDDDDLLINLSTHSLFHVLSHSLSRNYVFISLLIHLFTKSISHLTHPLFHLFMVFSDAFRAADQISFTC